MSDGGMGKAVYVFYLRSPPGGGMCFRNAPVPVNDRSGLRRWMCFFFPGPKPRAGSARRVRRANAGQVLPVPGDRLDERTAVRLARHVLCHNCVIIVSCFVSCFVS